LSPLPSTSVRPRQFWMSCVVAIRVPSGRCVRSAVPSADRRHPPVFDQTTQLAWLR
jgi:hypothetical protein